MNNTTSGKPNDATGIPASLSIELRVMSRLTGSSVMAIATRSMRMVIVSVRVKPDIGSSTGSEEELTLCMRVSCSPKCGWELIMVNRDRPGIFGRTNPTLNKQ